MEKDTEKVLLSLKKELKCWESMFQRRHDRKPSKADIEKSPAEIQDAYRQYRQLKSQQTSSNGAINGTAHQLETTPNKHAEEDEVFGPALNKPAKVGKVETAPAKTSEGRSVWRVRRWTKDRGYVTVKSDGVRGGGGGDVRDTGDDIPSAVESIGDEKEQLEDTLKFSQLEDDLQTLTQELRLPPVTRSPSNCPSKPVVPGECQNVLLAQRGGRTGSRLKHTSRISKQWLGRCGAQLEADKEGCGTSSEETKEELEEMPSEEDKRREKSPLSNETNFLIRETLNIDDDFTTWSGDEMTRSSTDSSDEEDPVISSESAEMKWNELSTNGLKPNLSDSEKVDEKIGKNDCSSGENVSRVYSIDHTHTGRRGSQCMDNTLNAEKSFFKSSDSVKRINVFPTSALGKLDTRPATSLSTPATSKSGHRPKQWMFHHDSNFLKTREPQKPKQNRRADTTVDGRSTSSAPETSSSSSVVKTTKVSVNNHPSHITESVSEEQDGFDCEFSEAELAEFEQMDTDTLPSSPNRPDPLDEPSDDPERAESENPGAKKSNKPLPSKSKPTSHPSSSAVSDNFVRLNMKVKRFSRKRGLTGSAHKRLAWKKMQKGRVSSFGGGGRGFAKSGRSVCFKCGNPGHWAKNCDAGVGSKNLGKFDGEEVGFSDKMAANEEEGIDDTTLEQLAKDSPFPSVEDAALMARGIKFGTRKEDQSTSLTGDVSQTDECSTNSSEGPRQFIAPPPSYSRPAARSRSVQPLFPPVDGEITATPSSVYSALREFGYDSFRPGQEAAVMRVLSGVSTLLINSTGSGKSLCYQLPAFLYSQSSSCLALIISPLVSLMEDQTRHFPTGVKGGCLHTSQTRAQRDKVLRDAVDGKLNVLLLSPEALVGGSLWSRSGGGAYSLSQLPPVAFACIDEAHCVSEWSHNFRPSYLRVYKVLRERLGVYCVLALTATATHQTAISVATNLGIAPENIIRGPTLPDNLHISVSCDQDRDQGLVELLQSSTFKSLESIIIYCTRQQETERVAQLLRTCLVAIPTSGTGYLDCDLEEETVSNSKNRKRKTQGTAGSKKGSKRQKVDWSAECYHAGMQASRRRKVQSDFMSGRLRIVVATVAFGMGLNKSDVRAIIHYNLPKSFESFVQEIGRAGRDGLPAYCHVFIDKMGGDLSELRRHAYSNSVDRYCIKQLVSKAFPSCQCRQQKQNSDEGWLTECSENSSPPKMSHPRWCSGHEVAVSIDEMVTGLDVKEECVSTLLCYLELEDWLEVMNPVNDSCTLKCYNGAKQLRALAGKVPAVAAAAARLREKGTDLTQSSAITFSVTEVADSMGWESHIVRSELGGLSVNDRGTGGPNTTASSVLVEFGTLSFHLRAPGDLTPAERDAVCDFLYSKVKGQEEREVEKLHLFHAVLRSVAYQTHEECFENKEETAEKQNTLNRMIKKYFSKEGLSSSYLDQLNIPILTTQSALTPEQERQVCDDISALISIHSEHRFTGRAIARIFHGIASPLFEAIVWGGQKRFWRRHMDVGFNLLCQLATKELLNFR